MKSRSFEQVLREIHKSLELEQKAGYMMMRVQMVGCMTVREQMILHHKSLELEQKAGCMMMKERMVGYMTGMG